MSRINTNVNSLIAQRVLGQNNRTLSNTMQQLATGLRINRGADDPAGLIASEKLRAEQARLGAAIGNVERADSVMNIAEGGLQEVSKLLLDLQGLITETANTAGLSNEEKEANQLQIDSILSTIDRIAGTTNFQGTKLLNGNYDFRVDGVHANVQDYEVNAAKFTGSSQAIKATVTQSAQRGGLMIHVGAALNLSAATDTFSFVVNGMEGSKEFSFSSGSTLADMRDSINAFKSVTGVSASVQGTSGVLLRSVDFGSDAFVGVQVTGGGNKVIGSGTGIREMSATQNNTVKGGAATAFTTVSEVRHTGKDIGGTINGLVARGQGTTLSVISDQLDASITMKNTTAATQTPGSVTALTVRGGGATFALGASIDINNQARIGLGNVSSRVLGTTDISGTTYRLQDLGSGRHANAVNGKLEDAQKIVNTAIDNVSRLRGRIGAFQALTLQSTANSLGVAMENVTAAESAIRDTDFAKAAASMTRNQILVQAATSSLALANSQPQSALMLIG
ncbi:MAG: flagellin [Phycisphaeraceae bacterium]|nr:flagellin [Phycisphaeraceae bacterium]